ncbi:uncharacterized protein LOC120288210 [Eucalyptus grandis]|uniref:uncharacterized protein LOC120288210 n=1 Tax=Eucalyptus grandis TaxID=71139 RepID=UPI00192EF674|nr:uncharacterized protein LOC120288210 [Eucalyptus grandis]
MLLTVEIFSIVLCKCRLSMVFIIIIMKQSYQSGSSLLKKVLYLLGLLRTCVASFLDLFSLFHSTDEQDHGSQSFCRNFEANGRLLYNRRCRLNGDYMLASFTPFELLEAVNFGQIYGSHVQFCVKVSGGVAKKCGFRIVCKQLEEDLKVKLQDLMDPALLYEFGHESTYSKAMVPLMHGMIKTDIQNDLQDCPATPLSASRQLVSHLTTPNSDGCKIATYQRRRRRREEVCVPETESLVNRRQWRLESKGDGLPPSTEAMETDDLKDV